MSGASDRVEQGTIRATHVVMCILNEVFLERVKNSMDFGSQVAQIQSKVGTKYDLRKVTACCAGAIKKAGQIIEAIRIFTKEDDHVVEALEIISMNHEQWGRYIADKERAEPRDDA